MRSFTVRFSYRVKSLDLFKSRALKLKYPANGSLKHQQQHRGPRGLHTSCIREICKNVRDGYRAPERAVRAQPNGQPLRRKDDARARKLE